VPCVRPEPGDSIKAIELRYVVRMRWLWSSIKALPLGVGVPVVIGAASIGPEEAASNLSKWAHKLGLHDLPTWLLDKGADRYAIIGALIFAIVYLTIAFIAPRIIRHRRLRDTPAEIRKSADAPAEPSSAISEASAPSLLHRYEGDDRKRLSAVLYDLYELLNERVSPAQLAVHEMLRALPYRIQAEGSESIKKRLLELRTAFATARNQLIEQFMQGSHYYADEIKDITSDRDQLNLEIASLDNLSSVLDAIAETTPEKLSKLLEPYHGAVRDANFDLGSWVGRCGERIKAKRNALQ
jgi:hypothetical protein